MLADSVTVDGEGGATVLRRAAPFSRRWVADGHGARGLGALLRAVGRPGAAPAEARAALRARGLGFLYGVTSPRAGSGGFPSEFTVLAVADELALDASDAPFLFTPAADLAERVGAGRRGPAALAWFAARVNAGIHGRARGRDGLDALLRRAGSPGPWSSSLRRDRRPMACAGWAAVETDVAEAFDAAGRRLGTLWRQTADPRPDADGAAALADFAWAVCAAAGPGAGGGAAAGGVH